MHSGTSLYNCEHVDHEVSSFQEYRGVFGNGRQHYNCVCISPQVGSEWDGKESIFRNLGGILGAWDEPVAAIRLKGGTPGGINIVWDDPVGERVSMFVMKLEASWFVSFHKPKVE